jgi:hypothetical protein
MRRCMPPGYNNCDLLVMEHGVEAYRLHLKLYYGNSNLGLNVRCIICELVYISIRHMSENIHVQTVQISGQVKLLTRQFSSLA